MFIEAILFRKSIENGLPSCETSTCAAVWKESFLARVESIDFRRERPIEVHTFPLVTRLRSSSSLTSSGAMIPLWGIQNIAASNSSWDRHLPLKCLGEIAVHRNFQCDLRGNCSPSP